MLLTATGNKPTIGAGTECSDFPRPLPGTGGTGDSIHCGEGSSGNSNRMDGPQSPGGIQRCGFVATMTMGQRRSDFNSKPLSFFEDLSWDLLLEFCF